MSTVFTYIISSKTYILSSASIYYQYSVIMFESEKGTRWQQQKR